MARKPCRIAIVDDEAAMREVLQARLERWGFEVRTATNAAEARALVQTFEPHAVISDLVLPDATGLDLLQALRGSGDRVVLLITAYGTIDVAVQAIKFGATDFLTKPLDYVALRKHLEAVRDRVEASDASEPTEPPSPSPSRSSTSMIGCSAAFLRLLEVIERAATSEAPVFIVGESGSGKELVARTIHERSGRAGRAFVPVNAAAVPEALAEGEFFGYERGAFTGATAPHPGLFEQAHAGTLFLDEVTEMPAALQPKFLRVLEDGRVRRLGGRNETAFDVRMITATNRAPDEIVATGSFRHDLLYRLDVLRIRVPPLRERPEDIPLLTEHFLRDCERRYNKPAPRLTPEVTAWLRSHAWPGNIRELRNVIERAFVGTHDTELTSEALGLPDVDPRPATHGIVIPPGVTAAEAERILILETLKRTDNNKAETARRLGIDVKTVRNKLKSFAGRG